MNAPARATVAGQCDEKTARHLTLQIKQSLELSYTLMHEAYNRRAWAALHYSSWEEYCREEFGSGLRRLDKELRRGAVAELASGEDPMSNRAIAAVLGVSEGTVRTDLRAGAQNYAPGPEPAAGGINSDDPGVIEAEVVQVEVPAEARSCEERVEEVPPRKSVRRVRGADGKSYTTQPIVKRRRRPLPDALL